MTEAELARWSETAEALGVAGAMASAAVRGEGVAVEALGSARLVWAGPGSPLSRVYGFGFDGEVTGATLDAIEAFYAGHGVVDGRGIRIELSPYAHPSALPALRARGYGVEQFKDLLVRALGPGSGALPAPAIPVRSVDLADPAAVRAVALAVATGFGNGVAPDEAGVRLGIQLVAQPDAATFA
ncbi:MAG: hypothetical protein ABMB14_35465, partial [Myxococcota bacterium]